MRATAVALKSATLRRVSPCFSTLRRVSPFFSALNVAQLPCTAIQPCTAQLPTFSSNVSARWLSAPKSAHWKVPFYAVYHHFFQCWKHKFFSIGFTNIRSLNIWNHMFWLKKLCNNNKQNEIFKETQKNFQRFLSIEIFWKLWWNTSKDALTNESNKQQCKMLVGWSPHKMNEMKMQKTTFIL